MFTDAVEASWSDAASEQNHILLYILLKLCMLLVLCILLKLCMLLVLCILLMPCILLMLCVSHPLLTHAIWHVLWAD